MKTQFLALATLAIISLTSCNKDKDEDATRPKTRLEILMEKPWNARSITSNLYLQGQLINSRVEATSGITVDFRNDGTVISYQNNSPVDTLAYSLSSDNSMVMGDLQGSVDILNDSELQITFTIDEGTPDMPVLEEVYDFTR